MIKMIKGGCFSWFLEVKIGICYWRTRVKGQVFSLQSTYLTQESLHSLCRIVQHEIKLVDHFHLCQFWSFPVQCFQESLFETILCKWDRNCYSDVIDFSMVTLRKQYSLESNLTRVNIIQWLWYINYKCVYVCIAGNPGRKGTVFYSIQ